nr:hypothetical protein CFP56_31268 [Quercus suber]
MEFQQRGNRDIVEEDALYEYWTNLFSHISSVISFVKNLCLSFRLFPLYFSSPKSSSSFLRRSLLGNPGVVGRVQILKLKELEEKKKKERRKR